MENTKKKSNFNALDWIILILVVLCAVTFFVRYYQKAEIESDAVSGQYRVFFEVRDVRYTTADAFVPGDAVFVATDDTCIGHFDRLESNTPAAYYADDKNGGTIKVYYPEGTRVDLVGSLRSEGVLNEDGYFVGGTYFLAPGKKLTIYTGHVYVEVVITDITEWDA